MTGDPDEWRGAFSSHSGALLEFLKRRLPASEAEDLVQETFLRAMRHGTPSRIDNLRSYLYATAKHLALNSLRRPRPVFGLDERVAAEGDGPHENASYRSLAAALGRVLDSIPRNHRRAFELAVLEGRSYEEVARETGTTLAQVKVHVYRARRRLVEALGTYR